MSMWNLVEYLRRGERKYHGREEYIEGRKGNAEDNRVGKSRRRTAGGREGERWKRQAKGESGRQSPESLSDGHK